MFVGVTIATQLTRFPSDVKGNYDQILFVQKIIINRISKLGGLQHLGCSYWKIKSTPGWKQDL